MESFPEHRSVAGHQSERRSVKPLCRLKPLRPQTP
jgi:hypothetical protein